MKTNPRKRSKKKPSPAQLAARKKFIKMVRARAASRRKPRMKVTRHKRGTATRYKFSRPVPRAQAEALIAQHKRMRRNPSHVVLRCTLAPTLARKYYYDENKSWWLHTTGQCLTDEKRYAKRFSSDKDALHYAQEIRRGLVGTGVVEVKTERA